MSARPRTLVSMQSMSIAPFTARPVASEPDSERRRARIVLALAALGIAAALFAYAVSPSVRHAVGHAAHSVNHAVSRVFDRDAKQKAHAKPGAHSQARTCRDRRTCLKRWVFSTVHRARWLRR